ncbi:hypothetical protein [Parvularcula lutaonensis]|uniref:Uncharacterized protein n=1 Tax=Parvularcula lutaonensis TaxID=491923 RepID=A0ABV7M9U3_9PROT
MNDVSKDTFQISTEDIPEPTSQGGVSSGKIVHGKLIPPQQQILLFSADDWEAFVEEWAHYQRTQYKFVTRLSASADMGIDVAGFTDDEGFQGEWDNHQCKHYGNAIAPSTDPSPLNAASLSERMACLQEKSDGREALQTRGNHLEAA